VVDVYKKIIDACPYCGAMEMGMHTGIIDYRVACPICSATGPLHKDISTAIFLWNTVSRSWYNQSLTTHMPPAKEVSDETCDQLRRENDLLEEMISDRLGSLGELERGEDPGELELEGEPGELQLGGDPGELQLGGDPGELELEGEPGELQLGGEPGELERGGDPGELELSAGASGGARARRRRARARRRRARARRRRSEERSSAAPAPRGKLGLGVSPATIILAMKLLQCEKSLNEILSIMSKK